MQPEREDHTSSLVCSQLWDRRGVDQPYLEKSRGEQESIGRGHDDNRSAGGLGERTNGNGNRNTHKKVGGSESSWVSGSGSGELSTGGAGAGNTSGRSKLFTGSGGGEGGDSDNMLRRVGLSIRSAIDNVSSCKRIEIRITHCQ
jgi:hypothetical protein